MSVQLRQVGIYLTRAYEAAGAGKGLRKGTIGSLALIEANPGVSQGRLAEASALDKSAVVAIVDDLERRGWAVREAVEGDKRRHALYITPQGKTQLDRFLKAVKKTEDLLLSEVSNEDFKRLIAILERMHASCLAHIDEV